MKQQLHPTSLLRHLLTLVLVFTSLIGASAAEKYFTIEFLTGTNKDGLKISTSTKVSSEVDVNSQKYVTGYFTKATAAYGHSTFGFKLASGSSDGCMKFSLSEAYQKKIKKIAVKARSYSATEQRSISVTLSGDGQDVTNSINVTGTLASQSIDIAQDKQITVNSIQFDASEDKQCYVQSITLYYEEANPVATPTFSPAAGEVMMGTTVTISTATEGATIHYTTDGTEPTSTSDVFNSESPITINKATTIKAIAIKEGMTNSEVATASYTIAKVATPTFNPTAGELAKGEKVTISTATADAAIYYTTDETTPTASSTPYPADGITINATTTIKAIAIKANMDDSDIATATYSVVSVTAPTFSPESGEVLRGSTVTITSTTEGASIYYTTDETTPSASSTPYPEGGITINEATTIKAIAIKDGESSEVVTASYTIAKVATPVFSPVAGEIEKGTKVTITTATEGATIYYSTDPDATPATISTRYPEGGIVIHAATTIKAIAVKDNMDHSEVATAEYTIKEASSGDENIITLLMNCDKDTGQQLSKDDMGSKDAILDSESAGLVSGVSGSNLSGGTDYQVENTASTKRSIRIGRYANSSYPGGSFTINLETPVKIAKIVVSISSYKSSNDKAPEPKWNLTINDVSMAQITSDFTDIKKEFNYTPTAETSAISISTPAGSAPIDLQYIEIFPEFNKEEITTITWENEAYSCFIDEITQPKLLGVPDGVNVSYYVDDPSIANVSDNGEIIPYIPGMFTVTASWPETPKDETTTYSAGSVECLIELKSVAERSRQEGNTVQIPEIVITEGNDTENDFKSSVLSYSITGGFWYIGYITNLKLKLSTPETGASIQYHFDASDIDFDNNKVKAGTEATEPTWIDYVEDTEIPFSNNEGSLVFRAVKNGVYSPEETLKVSIVTGVEDIEVDSNDNSDSDARYFNLQGVEVKNPENGIFIRIANGKAVKVMR